MIHLEKYHGLGNDFLIILDTDGSRSVGEATARALCDRHAGVGADGVIHAMKADPATGADVVMHLRNADGSVAETSGNGLRCLARAARDAGWTTGRDVAILTEAGLRTLRFSGDQISVDMGPAKVRGGNGEGTLVDMGNPHLVIVVDDPATVDLNGLGQRHLDLNVEVIATTFVPHSLAMRVHERGVGETLACGTGACAAAAAAYDLGLVGDRVVVYQPGGAAVVEVGDDSVILTGPAVHVATIDAHIDGGSA
jgi:diaminopimelate epimerase